MIDQTRIIVLAREYLQTSKLHDPWLLNLVYPPGSRIASLLFFSCWIIRNGIASITLSFDSEAHEAIKDSISIIFQSVGELCVELASWPSFPLKMLFLCRLLYGYKANEKARRFILQR